MNNFSPYDHLRPRLSPKVIYREAIPTPSAFPTTPRPNFRPQRPLNDVQFMGSRPGRSLGSKSPSQVRYRLAPSISTQMSRLNGTNSIEYVNHQLPHYVVPVLYVPQRIMANEEVGRIPDSVSPSPFDIPEYPVEPESARYSYPQLESFQFCQFRETDLQYPGYQQEKPYFNQSPQLPSEVPLKKRRSERENNQQLTNFEIDMYDKLMKKMYGFTMRKNIDTTPEEDSLEESEIRNPKMQYLEAEPDLDRFDLQAANYASFAQQQNFNGEIGLHSNVVLEASSFSSQDLEDPLEYLSSALSEELCSETPTPEGAVGQEPPQYFQKDPKASAQPFQREPQTSKKDSPQQPPQKSPQTSQTRSDFNQHFNGDVNCPAKVKTSTGSQAETLPKPRRPSKMSQTCGEQEKVPFSGECFGKAPESKCTQTTGAKVNSACQTETRKEALEKQAKKKKKKKDADITVIIDSDADDDVIAALGPQFAEAIAKKNKKLSDLPSVDASPLNLSETSKKKSKT